MKLYNHNIESPWNIEARNQLKFILSRGYARVVEMLYETANSVSTNISSLWGILILIYIYIYIYLTTYTYSNHENFLFSLMKRQPQDKLRSHYHIICFFFFFSINEKTLLETKGKRLHLDREAKAAKSLNQNYRSYRQKKKKITTTTTKRNRTFTKQHWSFNQCFDQYHWLQ